MVNETASEPEPAPPLRQRVKGALRGILRNEQLALLVLAVIMGAVAAFGAIAFRYLYLFIQGVGFGAWSDTLVAHAQSLPAWRILLVPTAGGLLIGLFVHFFMPGRRPHAVADVMEAVAVRSGRMGMRAGLCSALVSATSIGVGGSVGREGPVVHLGASLCSWISRKLGLSRSLTINLLGCGVAAAIASSFNAPIAGTFFALEVIIGHYALTAFAPIVLASVTGTIISRTQFGNFPAFIVPGDHIISPLEFPAFALLGVVCAGVAIILMKSIGYTQEVAGKTPLPSWAHPMVGGLLIGIIALVFPQVLGVGYGTTDAALKEQLLLPMLIALLAAKMVAVALSLGTGFGGGVFSPSLFLGAMVGGAFGLIAAVPFPELASGHSAYTLVGMGAVAGAVLGAPISTILIMFELTGDYAVTVAVMVAVVISSVITQQVFGGSYFSKQLDRRGLNLRRGREEGLLAQTHVGDVMTAMFTAVSPATAMPALRQKLQIAPHAQLFVVTGDGVLHGTVTLGDLSGSAFDTSLDDVVNAADVARTHPHVLTPDTDLDVAIKLMEDVHEEHIAVVESLESMKMIGVVHEVEVMLAYNRALMRARAEEHGEL
ncbi:MAG: CIC family chloride channel protein [Alphaproteobacteria bacterium]